MRVNGVMMLQSRRAFGRKLAGLYFLVAACLALSSPVAAAPTAGPTEVVRNFDGVLLDLMQHASALGPKGRYQKLEPVVFGTFDVPFMARLSIGPSWMKLTARKSGWSEVYSRYIAGIHQRSNEHARNSSRRGRADQAAPPDEDPYHQVEW